ELWRAIVPRRACSPERLVLLASALSSLDVAEEARRLIAENDLIEALVRSRSRVMHPLFVLEAGARAEFRQAWSQLGLHWFEEIDGVRLPTPSRKASPAAAHSKP
ncbi:MAG: hypothetical protein ACREIA_20520, partial [Opitutaceae bacterium]